MLFTKSSKIGSSIIQWVTGEPVSHVAYEIDERIVFHSNFKGCHVEFRNSFLRSAEVVNSIKIEASLQTEERIYESISWISGKPYDFKALFYFAYCLMMKKCFGKPLPKRNLLNTNNSYFCVETWSALGPILNIAISDLDMTTPHQLYLSLKEQLCAVSNP